MKKTILILVAILLVTSSLFAAVTSETGDKKIVITAPVAAYTVFGVTSSPVDYNNFKSKALFESAVQDTIETEIEILDLSGNVDVGYVAGINNTKNAISLYISTTDLVSGSDIIPIKVVTNYAAIPGAADSKIGTLSSKLLQITESTPGASALAPAGDYEATLTISLTSN